MHYLRVNMSVYIHKSLILWKIHIEFVFLMLFEGKVIYLSIYLFMPTNLRNRNNIYAIISLAKLSKILYLSIHLSINNRKHKTSQNKTKNNDKKKAKQNNSDHIK